MQILRLAYMQKTLSGRYIVKKGTRWNNMGRMTSTRLTYIRESHFSNRHSAQGWFIAAIRTPQLHKSSPRKSGFGFRVLNARLIGERMWQSWVSILLLSSEERSGTGFWAALMENHACHFPLWLPSIFRLAFGKIYERRLLAEIPSRLPDTACWRMMASTNASGDRLPPPVQKSDPRTLAIKRVVAMRN